LSPDLIYRLYTSLVPLSITGTVEMKPENPAGYFSKKKQVLWREKQEIYINFYFCGHFVNPIRVRTSMMRFVLPSI
jgi:hypothetical protein